MTFTSEFFDRFHISVFQISNRMELLKSILFSFSELPYENVSKLISFAENGDVEKAMRGPETVWEGYRMYGLGGTCFSLTFFLRALLHHCGFKTLYFLADMKVARECHCGLIVQEGGKNYLIDPGYLIPHPIDLSMVPCRCATHLNDIIVVYENDNYHIYTETIHAGRKLRYVISSIFEIDDIFFAAWKRSFSLNSMNSLCLNRIFGNEQIYFHRDKIRLTSRYEKKNIKNSESTIELISDYFNIDAHIIQHAYDILGDKIR